MTNPDQVLYDLRHVGLYDLIYQDVCQRIGSDRPDDAAIAGALAAHPDLMDAYRQLNVEYNISNIHIDDLAGGSGDPALAQSVAAVNANLATLRTLEKYTLDFEHSSTLVFIFSIEFFVLFSVQYLIVLLGLKAWQWEIYGLFALSVAAAWLYARRERRRYARYAALFDATYRETRGLIDDLERRGAVTKQTLYRPVERL